jgi:glycosyltransferase involved in cell wall biosynthesis
VTHEHSTGDASLRYRSFYHAESLTLLGVSCDVERYRKAGLFESLDDYSCLVLHRVPWPEAAPLVERARALGLLLVTDTDDLVFDSDATEFIEAITEMSDDWRRSWAESYRATIDACSHAIVATEPLSRRLRSIVSPVEVLHNAVGEELIALSTRAREPHALERRNRADEEGVAIGYLSGSPTHRRDFEEVASSVSWALETYRHVRFVVVGDLRLDDRFESLGHRIEQVPFVPWRQLPEVLRQIDVNLAPLADNPFSSSKSCVKYLEAGLLEVPTVATRRGDFSRVIEHGRNGLFAESEADWRSAIQLLVEDPPLRRELGRQARVDVLQRHTTLARLPRVKRMWRSLSADRHENMPLTVDWLLGAGSASSPDHVAVIHRLAQSLTTKGHNVTVYEHGEAVDRPADVRIATDTETAYLVASQENALFKLRLVQEAGERGYELPLHHVCMGSALGARVNELTRRPAEILEPALDLGDQIAHVITRSCFLRLRSHSSIAAA